MRFLKIVTARVMLFVLSSILFIPLSVFAQSLSRPYIWVSPGEKAEVLAKIENYSWAQSLVNSMKSNVDAKLATHQVNPGSILSTVATFPANDGNSEAFASPYASAHCKVLSTAEYAAILYYITDDEKYASFAGDILAYYFDVISARTVANTTICGNYFYDPRKTYNHLAIAYDFVYNYLNKPGTTVYNKASNTRVAYDNAKAQKAIRNIAGNALNEAGGSDTWGKVVSNHPVLTAPGALFSILCVDDDTERERLFNIFWERGTKRQNSFKHTILKMFTEQGIWPESLSYGFMPNVQLVLNAVDKLKPELNAGEENVKLFESALLLENLRLPNRTFVRYGDSHRTSDGTDNSNRYALNFAKRRGFTNLQNQAEVALQQYYAASGGYRPAVPSDAFDNYIALDLFWGEPLPDGSVEKFNYKPTVVIKHAGVALQRNYVEKDNVDYGLCGIIGGAHYVHAHCTGIAMELYGGGDVMAPNGGLPPSLAERSTSPFVDYFNRYAGNNTVIVNGVSHGIQHPQGWGANRYLYQDTTKNIASEPKHLEDPISENFSFATQFLDDNVNNCDQQRTLSTIRTSATTGYYLDVFRSKSLIVNSFHDYVYHNIGDATNLTNINNEELSVSPTTRYQSYYNDVYKSPGWRLFEETQATEGTSEAVNIRFDLKSTGRYMHMFVPGGVTREYTKALGPATYEALNGYKNKKTQIIAIRQQGEAWDKPFVAVFEPSTNQNASIRSVSALQMGDKIVGTVVQSAIGQKIMTDYIIANDVPTETIEIEEGNISFTGRFAIIRKEEQNQTERFTLYIGEGTQLTGFGEVLDADEQKRGLKMVGELDTTIIKHDIDIEAEDYDLGGEGIAYHDRESTNYGTAKDYREAGGVDLSRSEYVSSGVVVSRVRPDEWLNYTFTVNKAHAYYLGIYASNPSYSNAAIHAYLDDSLIVEDLAITTTGNWNFYGISESPNTIVLDSGLHTLRIYIKQADFNFDKIILRKDLLYNAVKNTKAMEVKVFPNPCSNHLSIQLEDNQTSTYTLYSMSGVQVVKGQFIHQTTLSINNVKAGVYMLEIASEKGRSMRKVLIAK